MYTAFYGLREKPFSLSPDPRFLYLAEPHREALAHLLYGIEESEGFIAVTGEVGTGKTTLCRSLLGRLGSDTEIAFLFNPPRTPVELLRAIASELGLDADTQDRHALGQALNALLLARKREKRRVLLIVDEAQNLSASTLEQIRLLSNLETASEKLIHILLLGQPELDAKLDSPELRQLRQRIGVRWSLRPLDRDETASYVAHRIRIASGGGRPLFSDAALEEVHRRTGGVPRLVNVLCDRALLSGFADGAPQIDAPRVRKVAEEIPDTRRGQGDSRWRLPRLAWLRALGAAGLVAASVVAGIHFDGLRALWRGAWATQVAFLETGEPPAPAAEPALGRPTRAEGASVALPAVAAAPPGRLRSPAPVGAAPVLDALPVQPGVPEAARLRAVNTLLASFGLDELFLAPEDDGALLEALGRRGLASLSLETTDLATLRALNHPALVELRVADGSLRWAALRRLEPDRALLYGVGRRGALRLSVPDLETIWTGRATVVYRPFEDVPEVIGPGTSAAGIRWLQGALAELGLFAGSPDGSFDERTAAGVRALQATRSLVPDGAAGPRTQMVLYDLLDDYEVPRLVARGRAG